MPSRFAHELSHRVLVFDGAMGTSIHNCDCDLHRDYLDKENCTEILVQTRPDVIQGIHESFLSVGADVVETDTFGANQLVLAEFGLNHQTRALNRRAAEIARAACDLHSTTDKPRFVAGSIGPGTKLITLGHTDWPTMLDSYTEQARGLLQGGADLFIIETAQDILQVKCAINACLNALDEAGKSTDHIPILCSVTVETTGAMLLGTEIAAAAEALRNYPILSLGLNCATGPVEMAEHIHWLTHHWDRPVSCIPNAGLPILIDGRADYPLKPEPFVESILRFVENDGVRIVGGCCGTTPEHIRQLALAVGRVRPGAHHKTIAPPGCSSLYSPTEFRQDNSILIVGERTNTNGSRQFKDLLSEENWDALVSMGKALLRDGSHVLDVCVDFVGRDGVRDMTEVIRRFAQQVPAPLMIDSTQIDVIEAGLRHAPGKCIINSMNLEEGEEKLARICRLARTFGAAIVAGTIDEDPLEAMAKTASRKLAIAQRIYNLAVHKHGLPPHDLLFDPLVLPVTTGVEADRRLALETIEGVRLIARHLPLSNTMIGLSNVSFGLRPAARVVLNSVFMHECVNAGLTGAIVHASKILPRKDIPDDRWNAALNLLYDRRSAGDPLLIFIDLFPEGELGAARPLRPTLEDLPIEERLARHIIDGEMKNLKASLDQALQLYKPLDIINNHLLAGMKTVGELFGKGEMQLPFVLQSAEVMKAAVAHLEPFMEKVQGRRKGLMVLATVQGDVHDIGKNLVDIILSNNGYEVVNLGIKQPIANILAASRQHNAEAIGLSGLLVKSVAVMRENLNLMREQGVEVPVILGGAALTRHYAENDLRAVYNNAYYGRDAFEGLRFMDLLTSGRLPEIEAEIEQRRAKRAAAEDVISRSRAQRAAEAQEQSPAAVATLPARSEIEPSEPIPEPPFWGSRVVQSIDLDEIFPFINTVALFRGQWQFKKGAKSDADFQRQIDDQVEPLFQRLKAQCRDERILRPGVVYGWFPCNADADDLVIFDPHDHSREIERFPFPRQSGRQRLCIADFFRPIDSGARDVLGLHCVTMGPEVSRRTKALFDSNQYTEYLYLHGMGVESAEALAELWHKRMRAELAIAADDSPRIRELFTQNYRGSRYSFGYPACPDMSHQDKLFRLLQPERIGCHLTENWQIDPEQSTSALIVHHPKAKYFSV